MASDPKIPRQDRFTLRPVELPDDADFLRDLYCTTRYDVEGVFPDESLKRNFLMMQHEAQMAGYAEQFPRASHDIIELDGEAIGRIMVDRNPDSIRCVDLSLLPASRGSGIGTSLLKALLSECSDKGVPCLLKVLMTSRALALYERLGFRVEGNDGIRFSMRWEG